MSGPYHANFFTGGKSHRADLFDRLTVIRDNLKGTTSMLDIGTSGGYYSFALHDTFTNITAIDNVPDLIEDCNKIQKEHGTTIDFMVCDLKKILAGGDSWDCVLYMSVHHHVINQYGMQVANSLLKTLSNRSPLMFFDMGQKNENCPQHAWWQKLPATDNNEQWLRDYLSKNTSYNTFEIVGTTPIHGVQRILWKLER